MQTLKCVDCGRMFVLYVPLTGRARCEECRNPKASQDTDTRPSSTEEASTSWQAQAGNSTGERWAEPEPVQGGGGTFDGGGASGGYDSCGSDSSSSDSGSSSCGGGD